MKQPITFSQFCDAFHDMGRNEQFSYDAKRMLYDYLEDVTNGDYDLDVICLCCEYEEADHEYIASQYDIDLTNVDEDDRFQAVIDYLQYETSIVGYDEEKDIIVYFQF